LDPFQLTEEDVSDVHAIWLYLLEREGLDLADRAVTELFKEFYRLADMPSAGHSRPDLTDKPVLS